MSDLLFLFNIDDVLFDDLSQIRRTKSDGPYFHAIKLLNQARTAAKRQLQNLILSPYVQADIREIKKLQENMEQIGSLSFDGLAVQKLVKETWAYLDNALNSVHANLLRAKRAYTDPFAEDTPLPKHLVSIIRPDKKIYNSSLKNYAGMVLDTAKKRADTQAVVRRAKLSGLGLTTVQSSAKVGDNDCEEYVGKVYSVDASHPEYPPITSLPNGGPPLHPYCTKHLEIYLGD